MKMSPERRDLVKALAKSRTKRQRKEALRDIDRHDGKIATPKPPRWKWNRRLGFYT